MIVEKKHLMTLIPKNRTGWITLQNPPKLNKDPSFKVVDCNGRAYGAPNDYLLKIEEGTNKRLKEV